MWTRKRTIIGGQACPDDWLILYAGIPVARTFLGWRSNPTQEVWHWAVNAQHLTGSQGMRDTLEEALEAIRADLLARPDFPSSLP